MRKSKRIPKRVDHLERFTLRQRIAFLTGGLVFVMGLLLVLFINLIAPIFITRDIGVPDTDLLVETVNSQGNQSHGNYGNPSSKGVYDPS